MRVFPPNFGIASGTKHLLAVVWRSWLAGHGVMLNSSTPTPTGPIPTPSKRARGAGTSKGNQAQQWIWRTRLCNHSDP